MNEIKKGRDCKAVVFTFKRSEAGGCKATTE